MSSEMAFSSKVLDCYKRMPGSFTDMNNLINVMAKGKRGGEKTTQQQLVVAYISPRWPNKTVS